MLSNSITIFTFNQKINTMKKKIITALIILITLNLSAQSCQEALQFDGIIALFERKIESIYDSVNDKFINQKKIIKKTFFSVKGKEIQLDNKKYKISETEVDSDYNKEYEMVFTYVKHYCLDEFGGEHVIEYTKSDEIVYNVAIITYETDIKIVKTLYKH